MDETSPEMYIFAVETKAWAAENLQARTVAEEIS
jgi:hypothetical protein